MNDGYQVLLATIDAKPPNTARTYHQALREFATFAGAPSGEIGLRKLFKMPRGEANAAAAAWRGDMEKRGLSSSSVATRLYALTSIVRAGQRYGLCPYLLDVQVPKVQTFRDTRGPAWKKVAAAVRFLAPKKDEASIRDRAVILLMAVCGLRVSEALGLNASDLDVEGKRISILGKGRTAKQWVTIPPVCVKALEKAIADRTAGPVFQSKTDRRYRREDVWRTCQELDLGHPHGLRHASITRALDLSNGDLRIAAKFARHKNLQTILHYDDARSDAAGKVARLLAKDLVKAETVQEETP